MWPNIIKVSASHLEWTQTECHWGRTYPGGLGSQFSFGEERCTAHRYLVMVWRWVVARSSGYGVPKSKRYDLKYINVLFFNPIQVGPWDWYIYLCIKPQKSTIHVGKNTSHGWYGNSFFVLILDSFSEYCTGGAYWRLVSFDQAPRFQSSDKSMFSVYLRFDVFGGIFLEQSHPQNEFYMFDF